jgi:hypothetical protein
MPADRQAESSGLPPQLLAPTAEDADRERACKASTVEWSIRAWRGTARTARERLEQLRREGRVHDERWFARFGR